MIIITPLKQFDVIAWTISSQFNNSKISRCILNKNQFHLIIGHQYLDNISNMPDKYGIYQWEPITSSVFWKNKELFEKAEFVWEYSKQNIKNLAQKNIKATFFPLISTKLNWDKLCHFVKSEQTTYNLCDSLNSILLIGQMSIYRYKIFKMLTAVNLPIVWIKENCWGYNLKKNIQNCKIFLNLHSKKTNGLELARIMPALSLKTVVVSENSSDVETQKKLSQVVVFTDDIVNKLLELYHDTKKLNQIKENINKFCQDCNLEYPKFNLST